ncbi:MAG TPA: ABC transporter substrate-binding protein/permease [Thermoanaerobaculia bacterium]
MAAAFLLAAGAASAAPADTGRPGAATLAKIQKRHQLRWGMDAQGGAPYVFQSPTDPNLLVGFEVDVANAIAARLGVQAVPAQGQWEQLLDLLARGDFDVALNGIELAEEKKRVCIVSRPYFAAAERLTVRARDPHPPRSLADLRGQRVGTLPGSLAERILLRSGAVVRTYEGGQGEIYDDLRLGRTAAVLLDDPITRYYGLIEPDLKMVDGAVGEVQYVVAMRPGDTALPQAIDSAIDGLAKDGTLRSIYERWGLWTPETARLLHQDPRVRTPVAEEWEAWRSAVGKIPPFGERLLHRYPQTFAIFARAAALTLVLSLLAMVLAVMLGALLACCRLYGPLPLRTFAVVYVEFFRGTPLLIQLIMIYFGLPELGLTLHPFVAGLIALGLNYAAAEAENYRAGLLAVPATQMDAARVLGLTRFQALREVVAPQALRVALPPTTNDFIALLKDSSLVSVVTLTELTKTYGNLANSMRDHLGLGVVVALWYLVIGLPFARLSRGLEARLGSHLRPAA